MSAQAGMPSSGRRGIAVQVVIVLAVSAGSLLVTATPSQAAFTTLFTTMIGQTQLSPGPEGAPVGSQGDFKTYEAGFGFTPTVTGEANVAVAKVGCIGFRGGCTVTFQIQSDAGGQPSGEVLAQTQQTTTGTPTIAARSSTTPPRSRQERSTGS